jgi:hypothetical protein
MIPLILVAIMDGYCAGTQVQGEPVEEMNFPPEETRVLPVYLIYEKTGGTEAEQLDNQRRFVTFTLPKQQLLYFPSRFTRSENGWLWTFEADTGRKIVSHETLEANLLCYEVETNGMGKDPGPGWRYRFTFSLSKVIVKNKLLRQPGLYALEQAAELSKRSTGYARLESILYDNAKKSFEASVIVFD